MPNAKARLQETAIIIIVEIVFLCILVETLPVLETDGLSSDAV